jgi:5,10-methylenetetrahydromethanopterin reductase
MRAGLAIGIGVGDMLGHSQQPSAHSIAEVIAEAIAVEEGGFSTAWFAQPPFGPDTLTTIAVVGRHVPRLSLGAAVISVLPRHPVALAQQALTTDGAIGNRLQLGIGPSHKALMEDRYGLRFDRPVARLRSYLRALLPLLAQQQTDVDDGDFPVHMRLRVPGAAQVPVLLSALGPRMLELAGSVADGTITWMTDVRALRDYLVPTIRRAAEQAGRPSPRVIAALPVCVSDSPTEARARAHERFGGYGSIPSYRAALDRGGAREPADIAIIGNEESVHSALDELADAGASELLAVEFGTDEDIARTRALLKSRLPGKTNRPDVPTSEGAPGLSGRCS